MQTVDLHIFTNATVAAPSTDLINKTYGSFVDAFGSDLDVTVWCDPNPNIEKSQDYIDNLECVFKKINLTRSLSDGYVRAVQASTKPYLFMLEHDWLFLPTITHDLQTIIDVMRSDRIMHLRFNKRANRVWKSDKSLQEVQNTQMKYCVTNFLSNNPHLIDREIYAACALPMIKLREKSFGIEKELSSSDLTGCIYGPLEHPATIEHLDGKNFR